MKRLFLIGVLVGLMFVGGCAYLDWNKSYVYADEPIVTDAPKVTVLEEEHSATLDLGSLIAKLPSLSQAVCYSLESNKVKYAMSFTVISVLNDYINLDAMYVPSDEVGALLSVKLFNLGKWVKFPILEYIEFQPFVYVGIKNIGCGNDLLNSDVDKGVGAKIISIKF